MDRVAEFRKFPEIRTKRLVLREPTMKDAKWYLEHFSRPETVRGQGFPAPKNIGVARSELRQYMVDLYRKRMGFRWIILLKDGKIPVGSVGFYKWSPSADHQAEMGYDLDREYWGRGIMTEAMKAVIDFGFKRMKLNRVEVFIMPRNRRSIRLVKSLGFKKEGVLRQRSFDEFGDYSDDALFSLLRSEWESR